MNILDKIDSHLEELNAILSFELISTADPLYKTIVKLGKQEMAYEIIYQIRLQLIELRRNRGKDND